MHRDLSTQRANLLRIAGRIERRQDADLAQPRRDGAVDIRGNHPGIGCNPRHAADIDILANDRHQVRDFVPNGAPAGRKRLVKQCLERPVAGQGDRRQ